MPESELSLIFSVVRPVGTTLPKFGQRITMSGISHLNQLGRVVQNRMAAIADSVGSIKQCDFGTNFCLDAPRAIRCSRGPGPVRRRWIVDLVKFSATAISKKLRC